MKHTLVLAAALLFHALPCAAQSDDAMRGQAMWSDTPGASGVNTITGSCSNCHTVQDRRNAVSNGGGAFANLGFDTAMARLVSAVQNQGAMRTFQQLQLQDLRDLATYIADTPKTTADTLDFSATATNTATAAQTVDLRHSVAPVGTLASDRTLMVTGVAIGGSHAAQFTLASNACNGAQLQAGNTCRIGVTFSAPDTAGRTATLTISLRQGSQNFSRSVALSGAVAVTTPPPAGNGDSGGGGALGLGWLAALGAAIGALRWRRRSTRCEAA